MRLLILVSILLLSTMAQATTLSAAIERASKRYKVDARLLHAISQIESSKGRYAILRRNRNKTYDVGAFQINSIHWDTTCKNYDVFTLQGNANCAARLISMHKKHASTDPIWYARYHSTTPKFKNIYAKKVKVFLSKSDR